MSFQPQVGDLLTIRGVDYKVAEHPSAPGIPYGQEGRQGIVYQLIPTDTSHHSLAIKVFRPKYRLPSLVKQSKSLKLFAEGPGLTVCDRFVIIPEEDTELLTKQEDFLYSAVMPWITGPTWADVIIDKKELTKKDSLNIAMSLAKVLSSMEQHELAHCDLSAPNVLIPGLVNKDSKSIVELVDLEQMYSKKMDVPDVLPAGSPGYAAHKSIKMGLWSPLADRFSGSILLIEMLSWFDSEIRDNSWGDSYFEPQELQKETERYERMLGSLKGNWGEEIVQLFMRAWKSEELEQCPTFGEWVLKLGNIQLPSEEPSNTEKKMNWNFSESKEKVLAESAELKELEENEAKKSIDEQLEQAAQLEREGQLDKALVIYHSVLKSIDPSDSLAKELQIIIAELEQKLNPSQKFVTDPKKAVESKKPEVKQVQQTRASQNNENIQAKPKKKRKVVPVLIMVAVISFGLIGGVGYALREQIPVVKEFFPSEEPVQVTADPVEEEVDSVVEEPVGEKQVEEMGPMETISLWDTPFVAYSGNWEINKSENIVYLTSGEKNEYISYDLGKLQVGEGTISGSVIPTEGIEFELAFYVDNEEIYRTDKMKPMGTPTVPFEVPINGGNVLTIKVVNNSVEGDESQKSFFQLKNMKMDIISKSEITVPEHIESLWSNSFYAYKGRWDSNTSNHSVYMEYGEKNEYVTFDLRHLNIEESMLTGMIVPTSGIPFKLEYYVDNELVYTTNEIDPKNSGPVPINVLMKGKILSIKLVNNSVSGDDNQKSNFTLNDMLVNVHSTHVVKDEPSRESLWTKQIVAYEGYWETNSHDHYVYNDHGNNMDFLTYDLSDIKLNDAKVKGLLVSNGIPYKVEFKVDNKVVHVTDQIDPSTDVPQSFEIPVSGKLLTVTILNNSIDGDDEKKTTLIIKDFVLETN